MFGILKHIKARGIISMLCMAYPVNAARCVAKARDFSIKRQGDAWPCNVIRGVAMQRGARRGIFFRCLARYARAFSGEACKGMARGFKSLAF